VFKVTLKSITFWSRS